MGIEPYEILLLEEGDPNSGFRTKNAPGDQARSVLIDHGDALILRATLASVTHGDFTTDGDAATLLIFEFNFTSMKSSRRFTSGKVTLRFEDASGNVKNRPVVERIAPAGTFAINKTMSTRDVHQAFNAGVQGGAAGITSELGYVWETSKVEEIEHATRLVGTKRLLADFGKDDTVIWGLEEDTKKKQGIPSFLRAAVLLRRRDDVPFRFTIAVETELDFGGRLRRLLGLEKPDPVDPVELDKGTDLEELGLASLDPNAAGIDLANMRNMDIGKKADIVIATLIEVPG